MRRIGIPEDAKPFSISFGTLAAESDCCSDIEEDQRFFVRPSWKPLEERLMGSWCFRAEEQPRKRKEGWWSFGCTKILTRHVGCNKWPIQCYQPTVFQNCPSWPRLPNIQRRLCLKSWTAIHYMTSTKIERLVLFLVLHEWNDHKKTLQAPHECVFPRAQGIKRVRQRITMSE